MGQLFQGEVVPWPFNPHAAFFVDEDNLRRMHNGIIFMPPMGDMPFW